jgi:hypothetical protein
MINIISSQKCRRFYIEVSENLKICRKEFKIKKLLYYKKENANIRKNSNGENNHSRS